MGNEYGGAVGARVGVETGTGNARNNRAAALGRAAQPLPLWLRRTNSRTGPEPGGATKQTTTRRTRGLDGGGEVEEEVAAMERGNTGAKTKKGEDTGYGGEHKMLTQKPVGEGYEI